VLHLWLHCTVMNIVYGTGRLYIFCIAHHRSRKHDDMMLPTRQQPHSTACCNMVSIWMPELWFNVVQRPRTNEEAEGGHVEQRFERTMLGKRSFCRPSSSSPILDLSRRQSAPSTYIDFFKFYFFCFYSLYSSLL
jgi:hypothetical protein